MMEEEIENLKLLIRGGKLQARPEFGSRLRDAFKEYPSGRNNQEFYDQISEDVGRILPRFTNFKQHAFRVKVVDDFEDRHGGVLGVNIEYDLPTHCRDCGFYLYREWDAKDEDDFDEISWEYKCTHPQTEIIFEPFCGDQISERRHEKCPYHKLIDAATIQQHKEWRKREDRFNKMLLKTCYSGYRQKIQSYDKFVVVYRYKGKWDCTFNSCADTHYNNFKCHVKDKYVEGPVYFFPVYPEEKEQ